MVFSRALFLVPAIIGLIGTTAGLRGGPTLGSVQKIKQWGYSLKTLEGWKSVSPNTEERFTVGKWAPDLSELQKRGDYSGYQAQSNCELNVIRIAPKAAPAATADEEDDPKAKPASTVVRLGGRNSEKLKNPKSIEDYIEGLFDDISKRAVKKDFKAGSLPGTIMEFGASDRAVMIGIFKNEGVEWAFIYSAYEEAKKTWFDVYVKSLQSIKFFKPEGMPDESITGADITTLKGAEKRKALAASIAGNPGWYTIDKKNYVFLSNSKDRGFVDALARDIEIVRAKVYEKYFPPRNKEESLSPVRVLDTQDEYHQFGGPGGSAGYFNPGTGELVLFTQFTGETKKNSKEYCRSVMYHEAFHQYIHFAVGDVSPHSWFNEGHGDYFAGIVLTASGIRVDPFEWRVQFLKRHLSEGKDLIPLRSLIRLPQMEYYSNPGLKYSQGWAFVYWLRNVTKNKKYEAALDTYFTFLADNITALKQKTGTKSGSGGEVVPGIPSAGGLDFADREAAEKILDKAVDSAFEGVDLEKMDKEFLGWVKTL